MSLRSITLTNNLFDEVIFWLLPQTVFVQDDGSLLPVGPDMQLTAYNNLFHRGALVMLPVASTEHGNWLLSDNLFDQTVFWMDTIEPLDYSYNGYWPCASDDNALQWWQSDVSGSSTTLSPTTTGDGTTDGTGEVTLTMAPPYQLGPLGNYYLPTNTPLYQAGSTTADQLGLYHYTTQTNQVLETNAPVSIGLHYIATSNSLPMDTDGDGISDYEENWHGDGNYPSHTDTETDWQNQYTTVGVFDPTNSVYDNIDLSGEDLTGRAKRILQIEALSPLNTLLLNPVITGEEPYTLTYSVSLNTDLGSQQCKLMLLDNGYPSASTEVTGSNTYQLQWDTIFSAYGPHILQLALQMPGVGPNLNDPVAAATVNTVYGPIRMENSLNIIQCDPDITSFGSQMCINGNLQVGSADYQINIYDCHSNLLTTITNHTDNATINEIWDLTTNAGASPLTNSEFEAQIYVTPSDSSQNAHFSSVSKPYPVFYSHSGATSDAFEIAWGWSTCFFQSTSAMVQQSVGDIVFSPIVDNTYENTPLNAYNGIPFFCNTTNDAVTLLTDLADSNVGNFFWYGHGAKGYYFGTDITTTGDVGLSRVTADDIEKITHNKFRKHRLFKPNPYRLVIMDCCESASTASLAYAFGIDNKVHSKNWYLNKGESPQAYVGWPGDIELPGCNVQTDFINEYYGDHLATLFGLWMSEVPLKECVGQATLPLVNLLGAQVPFDLAVDPNYVIWGDPTLTRTPSTEP